MTPAAISVPRSLKQTSRHPCGPRVLSADAEAAEVERPPRDLAKVRFVAPAEMPHERRFFESDDGAVLQREQRPGDWHHPQES